MRRDLKVVYIYIYIGLIKGCLSSSIIAESGTFLLMF